MYQTLVQSAQGCQQQQIMLEVQLACGAHWIGETGSMSEAARTVLEPPVAQTEDTQ